MTTLNLATQDCDAAHNSPVTFSEAWASIMTCRVKREWAFNRRIPTPNELLCARENKPFSMSMFLDIPSNVAFDTSLYRVRIEDLICTSQRLDDGTYLGFVLNNLHSDFTVPCFTAFNPCFGDPKLDVVRLICGAVAGRLFVMEFCWMKSRALTTRFSPFKSLSVSSRSDLRMDHVVYAFLPSDASKLSVMALGPGGPKNDLVNARFDRILLAEDLYMLEASDTYFQIACVSCISLGLTICGCPLPMKRRSGAVADVVGYKQRSGKSLWDDFNTLKSCYARPTTVVFNITKAPHSRYAEVMDSGVFPFDTVLEHNFVTNNTLQKHLMLTGQSVYATRTVLVPFSLKGGRKGKPISLPSSVKDFAEPITVSSVDSNKPMCSLISSSSNNEPIPLIQSSSKRARVQNAAAQEGNARSNTVISMLANSSSVATEALSSNSRCTNGSERSRIAVENRCQSQTHFKVYPCPECGMLIKKKRYNLKRHILAVHQKERKFKCTFPSCDHRFQTKANFKRHVSTVHKRQNAVQEQEQQVEHEQRESL